MNRFGLLAVVLAAFLGTTIANHADAQGNSGKGGGKGGDKIKVDKPGKGAKAVPPGQVKRYTRGAKLPNDLDWEDIGDLDKWKLPAPGKGNKYIRVDNEILEVTEDLNTVVEAIGIVDDLLK